MKKSWKTVAGMSMAVPVAIGTGWAVRKFMTSAEGAVVPDEPMSESSKGKIEVVKEKAMGVAGKAGEMAGMMKKEKAGEKMEESMDTAAEAGQKAREAGEMAGEAAGSAAESMMGAAEDTAPGMMSWMQRNSRAVWGAVIGAFTLMTFWRMWRRRGKVDLGESGESLVQKIGDITAEAAEMLKDTTGDIRKRAVDELENQIDKLKAA